MPEISDAPGAVIERDSAQPVRVRARARLRVADVAFYAVLALVLAVGAWLRFDGQNWDDYTHLHPDERFLTDMVTRLGRTLSFSDSTAAERDAHRLRCEQRYPAEAVSDDQQSLYGGAGRGPYFDAECSPLNVNNLGQSVYVYGEFPLYTVHAAGVARTEFSRDYHAFLEAFDPDAAADHTVTTHWEGYSGAQFIGRSMSALADTLTILVLFLLGRRLYGRWPGLLAAAFYAFAAFPLQQSHFWTVDAFTGFWVTLALYFAVRAMDGAAGQQGPPVLVYLLIGFSGTVWDAAYHGYPMLGAVTLGALLLIVLVLTTAARYVMAGRGRSSGDLWVGASGVIASLVYLIVWTLLTVIAPHDFSIGDEMIALGIVSAVFSLAAMVAYVAAGVVRGHMLGLDANARNTLAVGAVGVMWIALVIGYVVGGLAPWATLYVALGAVALLVFDITDLTDYALFGVALGGAAASRANMAPLAGIIVLAALIRALPAVDIGIPRGERSRLIAYAVTGVIAAALLSFIVFRLLQPHAFTGPGIFGLKLNPGWRDDISEAAYFTSGDWDAPPNHQWTDRTPYLFPWRNIVEWGFGVPLGLVAWAAWAWAGVTIVRGRANWTRHVLLFMWVLLVFGWLGGRWVTTMRYFLPIYPALALFAAWALCALVIEARRRVGERPPRHSRGSRRFGGVARRRAALAGSLTLLIGVLGYTVAYGVGFHNIHRHQLTRVAASRWFQEFVPGDFGIWVEGTDGTRQMANIGRTYVTAPPTVYRLEEGAPVEVPFTLMADAHLTGVTLGRLSDPLGDPGDEVVRVRIVRDDPAYGRQTVFEDMVRADFAQSLSIYGSAYSLAPADDVSLPKLLGDQTIANYIVSLSVVEGGPVNVIRDVTDAEGPTLTDISLRVRLDSDQTFTSIELMLPDQPIISGHGDDIPRTPTHWTVGGSDPISFPVPIDGTIREIEIPHLGDPLRDEGVESMRLTLTAPDGTQTVAMIEGDFSEGADPLGLPQTVVFDPPLEVRKYDREGNQQSVTLTVEAYDPVYTSGPVIAWEGDWDDPVPWPVCPLPDDVVYSDDLPSGLSSYTCASMNMYDGHYQGLKLWMFFEDNDLKLQAMTNALDQADYLVITSNRAYDSLTRIPSRWPMSKAFYEALFDGRLGFELVKTFESYPRLGPFEVPDQILPPDLPWDTLNEYWEAEEAFHVYDHPVVLVYRKTDAYTPANTRGILTSVSIRSVRSALPGFVADSEPVGVVPWGAKQASDTPTLLQFTDEQWETQREGGTWSDLFDLDALINESQAFAVIVWWLALVIAGWLVWPLLFAMFPALPDRAFPAAKITAWMLVAWIAWVGGTAGLHVWSRSGIALVFLGLGVLSVLVIWRRRAEFWRYVRANRRHLFAMEGLTLALFLAFLGVRQSNPDLWHGSFGGEKPMDFAYFNAVLRSTIFPPIDPWFSQGYINYYYFGYVIVGAPVKLLGIQPSVAYNLIIPTLFSLTGVGVFSVAYNWVRARGVTPGAVDGATFDASVMVDAGADRALDQDATDHILGEGAANAPTETQDTTIAADFVIEPEQHPAREPRLPAGSAWLAGFLALLLAVILGNLGTLHVIVTNVAKLDGWEQPLLYTQVRRQEAEIKRNYIYEDYYDELVNDFRREYGYEPTEPGDVADITREAQLKTDAYIEDYAQHPPLYKLWNYELGNLSDQIGSFFAGLGKVMSGTPLPMHTHRWYWGPTRIITELPNNSGGGAIAEMPYFTFLYGDLHAHMIAFPVTLLVILWLTAEIMGAGYRLRRWWEAGLSICLGGLAVGVLRPTNTWDWITYLILGAAGLTYVAWVGAVRTRDDESRSAVADWLWARLSPSRARQLALALVAIPLALVARVAYYIVRKMQADQQMTRGLKAGEELIDPTLTASSVLLWVVAGLALVVVLYVALLIMARARLDKRLLLAWLGRVALFVALTFVTALPFTMFFASAYNSVKPWESQTTPLWAYMYVHGTFIFIVISFLLWQTARWLRAVRVRDLQGLAVPVLGTGLALLLVMIGGIVYGVREAAVAQLTVPLIAWATVLFFLPRQHALLRAICALIVLALAISLGVELVVLDGDIGRQNTVFKFYLQVWFMLSIVGGVTLAWMLRSSARWSVGLRGAWQTGLALLFTLALFYPLLATQARWMDRFAKDDTPLTLDGMEYMKYAVHGESGVYFRLEGDYDMIRWLQQNVEGTPVIVEAHQYPSEYHWNGRISIYTGLPTILGWRFHQLQQHTLPDMDMLVQTRENNVAAFYEMAGSDGIRTAMHLIDNYDVEYIVVGALERATYSDIITGPETGEQTAGHSAGLAKFDTMVDLGLLDLVYEQPRCLETAITVFEECPAESVYIDKIYRVVTDAVYLGEVADGP